MSQANDSIAVTSGSGPLVATHTVNSKEHQVVMVADDSGHIQGSLPTYFFATPAIAVGANKLYCDIFNATSSGKVMDIRGLWLVPNGTVAVTGAVSIRLDLYRTSAVGTGTSASEAGVTPDPAAGCWSKFDEANAALPAQITMRASPTGGATISKWLFGMSVFPEETNAAAYATPGINWIPMFTYGQKLVVREGTGLLIKQNSVASVGSVSILMAFTLE
jgi:hypothetical protein